MKPVAHEVCVRRTDETLGLLLRITRTADELFVTFALGDRRRRGGVAFDPHMSWHRDGWFHEKTFGAKKAAQWRGPLNAVTGTEFVARTPCFRPDALPRSHSSSALMIVPAEALDMAHNGMHFYVEVVGVWREPETPPSAKLFQQALVAGHPHVVVSAYAMDFRAARAAIVERRRHEL